MRVSLNWVKQYVDVDVSIDELVHKIGVQLGAVEEVIDLGKKYQGIIVARVVSCEDHPNADRLHVCMIDDAGRAEGVTRNEQGYVQVVCGAPNVREGLLVAWLPPGSAVPSTVDKEPFTLEARELRGVVSNGMLASPRELAIGDQHDGILEIDEDAKPGDDFAKLYELDDYIIDIENKMFTHRPDCFGQLGVAREIAGILGKPFTSPDWYKAVRQNVLEHGARLPLELRNELPELAPRFMLVALSDITIKPSPIKLQTCLSRVGVRPINNVVDITNYLMLLTGQPTHAYDYDKVRALDASDKATLVVRHPHPGESLRLLNGKEIKPEAEEIMIATERQLIGVGGAMGGADTEVGENTKNVILECANFDMYSVRRTSMTHGIFTDAVTRFNKGQSPLQNDRIVGEALNLLGRYAGAKQASEIIDDNHVEGRGSVHPPVTVDAAFINSRLGLDLSAEDMRRLLENVEFSVSVSQLPATSHQLHITAPFWRTDIETREDVVEEVGRLHGFDKLPLVLPKRTITPTVKDGLLEFKSRVRAVLAKAGANEVLTYSFVHGNLLDKVGQDRTQAFQLGNAISPDLQYYRLSVLPSLLEKVHPNIKAGYDEFALFEMGKAHSVEMLDEDGLPGEFNRIALVFAAEPKTAEQKYYGAPYYQARKYLMELLAEFGLSDMKLTPLGKASFGDYKLIEQMTKPFEPTRAAVLQQGGLIVGVVGEFKASVKKALKLPDFCAGFETFHSFLQKSSGGQAYVSLPRFPKVEQDICLKVAADTSYQELFEFVWQKIKAAKPEQTFAMLGPVDIYQRQDDAEHKQITLRLSIASYERTLTDDEVSKLLDTVAEAAKSELQAERI